MTTISGDSITELFARAVRLTIDGEKVIPRGMDTRELLDVRLLLHEPRARLLAAPSGRVLNTAFAVAETVWILSGSDAPWIYEFNGQLRQYAEDDGILRGAYGPRLRCWDGHVDQLALALATLRGDPDSRRAVIQLYDPARDAGGHRDVPCTLGYRFHLRQGRLHMATTMRSQDLWTGLPYDVFAATTLHELMASWLGVELGVYHHHVDSLHLYEHDLDKAASVLNTTVPTSGKLPSLETPWEGFDALLADVRYGRRVNHPGWDTMTAVLASYQQWKRGQREAAVAKAEDIEGALGEGLRAWYAVLRGR
ncbi:thymidylate synthase [Nonomuraea sp. CA-218870]|uniref:Thymidylate synthase n=1 Tax=Nonomuraea corallina TaxID=2989783 RepID=A0ABT4SBC7_9ACTN|nr:thymidylate synthase [Nonomuraea corallina]MDA0634368.1 thymidylate synthase [Nonomuraea corallina]